MNSRALFLPLVVSASLLFLPACRSMYPAPVPPLGAGCTAGVNRPDAPIVCINDLGTELSAHPETITVYDRDPKKQGLPMVILFLTKSGTGTVQIIPRTGNCIEQPAEHHCPPDSGVCRVHMLRRNPTDPKTETCKYDVVMKGFEPLDPYIVASTCCGT